MQRLLLNKLLIFAVSSILALPLETYAKVTTVTDSQLTQREKEMQKAAKDYESIMIHQFIKQMHNNVPVDPLVGGGNGEKMFKDLLYAEYAKAMTEKGGIGLVESIVKDLKQKDTLYKNLSTAKHE